MKNKLTTKLLAMAVALAVATTAAPVSVEAAPVYSTEETLYRSNKSASSTSYTSISVSNLTKSQTIAKSSVKSSKTSVAKPYYLEKSTSSYSYKTQFFENESWDNDYKSTNYSYYIGLQLKETGTATISFKIKGIDATQKVKVIVKQYTNPVKSMKVSGISSDLKSKTKSQNYTSVKMKKTTKNATVKVTPASGWKISSAEVYDVNNQRYTRTYSYSKPMSSATLNVGTLTKNKPYNIYVTFVNSKNGATITCSYYINN